MKIKKLIIILLIGVAGCVTVRVITGTDNETSRENTKKGIDSTVNKTDSL